MKDNTTFMGKYAIWVVACVIAVLLAGYMAYRINDQKAKFDQKVKTNLKISDGYDEQFINMVNRLEDELAQRASFGYAGRKDPMTGTTRAVAVQQERVVARRIARNVVQKPAAAAEVAKADDKPLEEIDPVRLTAIIFDNTKRVYTAVVMDGDRSFSVEIGDRVAGRRVSSITNDEIQMDTADERFIYNILGGNTRINKRAN